MGVRIPHSVTLGHPCRPSARSRCKPILGLIRVCGVSTSINYERAAGRERTKAKLVSFDAFYRDAYQPMLGIAIALTSNSAEAEDLVQEAFVAAHRRWDQVSQYEAPGAWVRRVLINRATSLRRRWVAELRAKARMGPEEAQPPDLGPEAAGVWREVRRLPRRQQQAIALQYVAELSMDEIADVMGCSAGAVKSHLHRARESLRDSLAAWNEEEL